MIFTCFIFCFFVVFSLLVRVLYILHRMNQRRKPNLAEGRSPEVDIKTMIIIGSGGHTAEMVTMLSAIGQHYSPRHYILARTDKMSEDKVHQLESERKDKDKPYFVHRLPRSREVGQSYLTSVLSTLYSTLYSIPLVFRHRPDLILTNGPGTCIPPCAAAFLLKVLFIKNVRLVFVESICRVETLSLSGKILYYFADHLLVQWPQLARKFPRTRYIGRIV